MGTLDAYFHANLGTPMPIFTRIWASRCLYLRWIWASRHENRHHILMPISTKNMGTPLWKWYEFMELDACKTIHYTFQVVQQTIWLLQLHDYPSHANSKNAVVVNYLVGAKLQWMSSNRRRISKKSIGSLAHCAYCRPWRVHAGADSAKAESRDIEQ